MLLIANNQRKLDSVTVQNGKSDNFLNLLNHKLCILVVVSLKQQKMTCTYTEETEISFVYNKNRKRGQKKIYTNFLGH